MKRIFITLFLLLNVCVLSAQSLSTREAFMKRREATLNKFKEKREDAYTAYLKKRNEAYVRILATQWEHVQAFNPIEIPERYYPKEPVVLPEELPETPPEKIPVKSVVENPPVEPVAPEFEPSDPAPEPVIEPAPAPKPVSVPKPEAKPVQKPVSIPKPTPKPAPKPQGSFAFNFLGSKLSVNLTAAHRFALSSVKEGEVARRWSALAADGSMASVVKECIALKKALRLGDYLYVLMLDEMCNSFFGARQHNEARLLKTYILTQSGYDAKCARCSAGLVVLLSIEEPIYQKSYLTMDGTRYYVIDEPHNSNRQYYTFSQKFSDKSKSCSVRIEDEVVVNQNLTASRSLASQRYPSLKVTTSVDKDLLKLYNNYPRCKWDVYAKAPMSSHLTNKIMPTLKAAIAGKSEQEAANMIINFVQTAFDYKTDDDYFGYERSLFVDETFYYPYSDCEDRSILFSNLVKRLLHLDVVLLYYPNHIATAVRFNGDCRGDYVEVNGKKYTVCDPTYIGAEIGNAMPKFKRTAAEVIML